MGSCEQQLEALTDISLFVVSYNSQLYISQCMGILTFEIPCKNLRPNRIDKQEVTELTHITL